MIFNTAMFGILMGISAGTWLLVNRVFLKSSVKLVMGQIHKQYLVERGYSLEKVERWSVSLAVVAVAVFLVLLAHTTSMYVVIRDVGEFNYAGKLTEASFVRCFLDVDPVEWSLLWYFDIVATIAMIVTGSKLLHRAEQYFGFKYDSQKKAAQ